MIVTSTDEYEIVIPEPVFFPELIINGETCAGESDGNFAIDTVTGGTPPYLYSLDNTSFTSLEYYGNLSPGNYMLNIQDADGCEWAMDVNIPAALPLVLELGDDDQINLGDSLQLYTFISFDPDTIIWNFEESLSCLNCLEPVVQPVYQTTYTVTAIDTSGCVISDDITISVDLTRRVYIPNTFSPNADGINDNFMIYSGADVRIVRQFRIFDRWGANLFSATNFPTNDPQYSWDGTHNGEEMNPGVYLFYAEIEFMDGRTEILNGDITIMKQIKLFQLKILYEFQFL